MALKINSSATISAPPTTNTSAGSSSGNLPPVEPAKTLITTTGTTSKIMHPAEDVSLEELRARKSKYAKQIALAVASANHAASQAATSIARTTPTSMPSVTSAHEVSEKLIFLDGFFFVFLYFFIDKHRVFSKQLLWLMLKQQQINKNTLMILIELL